MSNYNHENNRSLQKDARAWAKFTGNSYTAALRQMQSPLAQGFLGEPISARGLIATLEDHPIIGLHSEHPLRGENGVNSESDWEFNYTELALLVDMLRMFTPVRSARNADVGSYSLKHTAERLLSRYVSNGKVIWAAAALGLPISTGTGNGPNVNIGINGREHDYVSKSTRRQLDAHHFRPAAYDHFMTALQAATNGEPLSGRWVQQEPTVTTSPFHEWLIEQSMRDDQVGDLAGDYSEGYWASQHKMAYSPGDLLDIVQVPYCSDEIYALVRAAIGEWLSQPGTTTSFRTKLITTSKSDTFGQGTGQRLDERYDFRCPCGSGTIVEEHDNTPGHQDHSVRIVCDSCHDLWTFAKGPVRQWSLLPRG